MSSGLVAELSGAQKPRRKPRGETQYVSTGRVGSVREAHDTLIFRKAPHRAVQIVFHVVRAVAADPVI